MPVDCYGSCHHNKDLENGETLDTTEGRIALMRKNRFVMAFEEGNEKDYMTWVTFEALLSGSVPVILGAGNSNQILPKNCCVFANGYNSWDQLGKDLAELAKDQKRWEAYHEWRSDPIELAKFDEKFEFASTSSECRTCSWALAKHYGLGWDHFKQQIKANKINRNLCIGKNSDNKYVVQPFRETWIANSRTDNSAGSNSDCAVPTTMSDSSALPVTGTESMKIRRFVVSHDGVTDVSIQAIESPDPSATTITLRLFLKEVRNSEGAHFPNPHALVLHTSNSTAPLQPISSITIQDEYSKVTVLTNFRTDISSPREGIIDIGVPVSDVVQNTAGLHRIRVITEDMNELHDKMTEFFPSSYGKMMMQDFMDPLQFFYSA